MHTSAPYHLATPARRLGAYVLDWLYTYLAMLVLANLLGQRGGGGYLVMFLGIAYIVVGAYFWSKGTSPGKQTLGMYVYDKRSGYPLGFWSMALREIVGKWISGLVFSLGYIWILLDDQHQGWHDKLVGSVVLQSGR